MVTCQP